MTPQVLRKLLATAAALNQRDVAERDRLKPAASIVIKTVQRTPVTV